MRRTLLVLLPATLIFTASGAGQFTPGSDVEANRRMLRELRETDPAQYARLKRNFERFRALPEPRREALRELDRDLHEQDFATQARLLRILGEYGSWLSRLPEADRQRVTEAATAEERLGVVRELRDQEWVRRLPPSRFQQWKKASEPERRRLVEQWRKEEHSGREEWAEVRRLESLAQADRPMSPFAQESFQRELRTFLEKRLMPQLSDEEKQRLSPNDGDPRRFNSVWQWPRTIVELSDAHPVLALEPKFARKAELPEEYRRALEQAPTSAAREAVARLPEGRWPDYPRAVTKLLRSWKVEMKTPLGPARTEDFPLEVIQFILGLAPADQDRLRKVQGQWPEYPLLLHEIARERKLAIPEMSLPGDPRMWDQVRSRPVGPPRPSEEMLRLFVSQWSRRDPSLAGLSLRDPADREIIERKFNEAYKDWHRRMPMGGPDRFRGGKKQ